MTMEQYIDKSALAAEIERRRSKNARNKLNLAAAFEDDYLLSFLNTLEVKEVDFETEWKKYFEYKGNLATVNVKDLAKHFFDLGIKSKGEEVRENNSVWHNITEEPQYNQDGRTDFVVDSYYGHIGREAHTYDSEQWAAHLSFVENMEFRWAYENDLIDFD